MEETRINVKKNINQMLYENRMEICHQLKFVANIIKDDFLIYRECLLTMFSIDPNDNYFDEIKMIAGGQQGIIFFFCFYLIS